MGLSEDERQTFFAELDACLPLVGGQSEARDGCCFGMLVECAGGGCALSRGAFTITASAQDDENQGL